MDTQDAIGKLIDASQQRDAIHIAVAPVVAAESLKPGQHIALVDGEAVASGVHIGIVDPFLSAPVRSGHRFFMFLYPNTIRSLRHEWTHPAFGGPTAIKSDSEIWLRTFAERYAGDYEGMIAAALSGASYCFGSDIEYEDFHANAEFWMHVENVTGRRLEREQRENNNNFRCAC